MWRSAFETWHPAVPAACLAGTIVLAMFGLAPACVAISLAGGLAFALATQGARRALGKLRWQLPLLLLVCVINPLYSAMGSTLLCRVGPIRVYAESLAYGAVMGALLVATLLWFEAAGQIVDQDDLLELGGGLTPVVALALSMVMRLIPQLMRRARAARMALRASGPRMGPMPEASRLMGSLLTWSLEDSVGRADSMRARGWGSPGRRSTYRSHRFRSRDAAALACVVALVVASAWGVRATVGSWRFYPRMHGEASLWALAPYALLCLLPTAVVLIERWRGEVRP